MPRSLRDYSGAILALAGELQIQLPVEDTSNTLALSEAVVKDLGKHLNRLPPLLDINSIPTRRQLDSEGTKLWNTCVQRMRTVRNNNDIVLLCKVKALAYAMMEAAAPRTSPGNYRSLELAFKTIKLCIEQGLVDLGQKIMESAAMRLDMIERSKGDIDQLKLASFSIEYYMLRIYLSFSQGRPDIADHLFLKIPEINIKEQQDTVVDICYTIGNKALTLNQHDTARMWLDRALTIWRLPFHHASQGYERSWKDKKLLILHAFARSNLQSPELGSENKLHETLELMKTEYGDSFAVRVLLLQALKETPTNQEYLETLEYSINEMGLDDASVNIIFFYIKRLGTLNPELFIKFLGQLLEKLLLSDNDSKAQWIERIILTMVWVLTQRVTSGDDDGSTTKATLAKLNEYRQVQLGEEATEASLILIWKHVDTALSKGAIWVVEQWCCFALECKLFQMSLHTKAKFFRKLIVCGLETGKSAIARRLFNEIPEEYMSCPLTLYSMYKLALSVEDTSQVFRYLESLCKLSADNTYIWSCIADTLQLGKVELAMQGIERLVTTSDDASFERLQVLKLSQYVVHFVCGEEINRINDGHLINNIGFLFNVVLRRASNQKQQKLFSSFDLRWFSRKAYNVAIESKSSASSEVVVSLLDTSIKFIELCGQEREAQTDDGLSEQFILSYFFKTTVFISDARKENNRVNKDRYYREARETIRSFQVNMQCKEEDFNATTQQHAWLEKHRIMHSLDFEAAVALRQWDDIVRIIEVSKPVVDAKISSIFLDCVLRSGAPASDLARIVKQMIRMLHTSPSPFLNTTTFSFDKVLPRYLRCLFTLSLKAEEYSLAESVLDQALTFAHANPKCYPTEEKQWLVTVSFNRAVDFFLVSADEDCRRWAGKAIAMANFIEVDGGELGRALRQNLSKLLPE